MKEKEEKKIIKIRLINVVFLLFLIFILIIGINSNKLTTKQKIQEAAQNALSKSNTEYLETDEFVKELNKKLGENNYKLQTSENGYLVKTSSNQTYSVTNKGRTSQLRWTTNESDNKIIDSEGNEYNIGDYIDYNPNIATDSSKIVDFVNPIWETENRKLELNDNNIATMKFTLRGSDTYYASDTIAPGTYNATSEELKKNFKLYVNAKEANSNVKVTIHPGKKLMESRTIDGVTKEIQYGITYEVEIYTATENIEQVKITIPKGTIIDETKNENEEKSFIVFDVLRPTNTEKTEDSKFLNIDGIKRKDIEKITFVKSKSEVIGKNYYDVSAVGSSTIIAGYEDKDGNGKYEVYIGSDFDIYVNRDTSYLFANTGITTIENINLLNTINSVNMEYMFTNCANLQEITFFSKFDTKNVRNMQEMFGGCSTFKNITLSDATDALQITKDSLCQILKTDGNTAADTKNEATGLQNGMRVAFALYSGKGLTTDNAATIISATTGTGKKISNVAIWEPNANYHVDYTKSFFSRKTPQIIVTPTMVTKLNTLNGAAADHLYTLNAIDGDENNKILRLGTQGVYDTYAVNSTAIVSASDSSKNVLTDVYNHTVDATKVTLQKTLKTKLTFDDTTSTTPKDYTMATTSYTDRQLIVADSETDDTNFAIPANATVRVRVYVWLEGQDIDCIANASHGKGVNLVIGLEKQPTANT